MIGINICMKLANMPSVSVSRRSLVCWVSFEAIKCLKLIPQILVEFLRSRSDPLTALNLINRGSVFRVGAEASEQEVEHLLRMSLILFSEGSVQNVEEALLRAVSVVNLIKDLSFYFSEREILGHYHQKSHG